MVVDEVEDDILYTVNYDENGNFLSRDNKNKSNILHKVKKVDFSYDEESKTLGKNSKTKIQALGLLTLVVLIGFWLVAPNS